jgi:hypothetical protein
MAKQALLDCRVGYCRREASPVVQLPSYFHVRMCACAPSPNAQLRVVVTSFGMVRRLLPGTPGCLVLILLPATKHVELRRYHFPNDGARVTQRPIMGLLIRCKRADYIRIREAEVWYWDK